MHISGSQFEDIFFIGLGLFAAVGGVTSTKFYPYDSPSDAKPLNIPIWIGRSFFLVIGFLFVLMGMLDLFGIFKFARGE